MHSMLVVAAALFGTCDDQESDGQEVEATWTARLENSATGASVGHDDPSAGARAGLGVEIELAVRGDADGTSNFSSSPMWGGIDRCWRFLHALTFRGPDGTPLAVDHPDDDHWIAHHEPGAAITASWWIEPLNEPLPQALGNDYRPRIEPKLFHLIGNTGLLKPDALADDQPHRLRWQWEGFAEAGWKVASSFGSDPGVTVQERLEAFTHAVFVAGDLRLHEREVRGQRLLFVVHGDALGAADTELVDLGTRIVTAERAFFDDWSDPLYVVTAVPERVTDRTGTSFGGTGLTHSFALFLSRGINIAPGADDRLRIAHLLAHEYFHRWNGGAIELEQPEGLGYWFSEGFTDFFARRILLRCGIYDVAQFVASLNESLRNHALSPVRDAPATRIAADFWNDRDVSLLPYRRGDLVALALDHEIRATSDGKQSLDDFMREAIRRGQGGEVLTTPNLMELVADYTSQEFADRIRAVVVAGAPLELDPETCAPLLYLGSRKVADGTGRPPREVPFFETSAGLDVALARQRL